MSDQIPSVMVQPRIVGYRQLSQADAAVINEIKAHGAALEVMIAKVRGLAVEDGSLQEQAEAARWAATAKTQLQLGLMALTRAVARPQGF